MRYESTGGEVSGLTFEQALFTLYASDGGLLMPESVPQLKKLELETLARLSYLKLCIRIARYFIDPAEIATDELSVVLTEAYKTLDLNLQSPRIHQLADSVSVLEMFHAPTLCFKDYAMCFTTALMNHFLKKRQAKCVSLVATSGDTGGSAIRAVESLGSSSRLGLVVLLPVGRVSAYQRVAMTTSQCDRVRVASVTMDSDQLDDVIRTATLQRQRRTADGDQCDGTLLCTQNSANWGRVLFQIPAYFYAYFSATRCIGQQVQFFVPTGGCGNLTAACLARAMGLPIATCAANNQNAAAHQLISEGRFLPRPSVCTTSVAMDIANPYNIPRLLSLLAGSRSRAAELSRRFDSKQPVELTEQERAKLANLGVSSFVATDADCQATVVKAHSELGYLACPHTACALLPALEPSSADADKVADSTGANSGANLAPPRVVFATAHPAKFADLYRARGLPTAPAETAAEALERLSRLPERCLSWESDSIDDCVAKLHGLIDHLLAQSLSA
ncbi:hypothetical protein BOX15_Mlig018966g1 [Macrostomum lignano]|uniref:Threonine synthase N-terminal domain-containing protein n=2 Tax=Macrostomum lignano TaxID=282301 RepID=A0A267FID7_9PLAT|nr:hypothetical protein BOX15_Mlig018966g1 [Macrostomum lignano]